MLTSRQIDILRVVISDFIDQATPVGSVKLKDQHQLPYSTATIRNEMAYLEEIGLLTKPHTSAGRVPSNLGYRYYVDYLVNDDAVDQSMKEKIEEIFNNRKLAIDDIVREATNLVAEMTNYTSIALGNENEEILNKVQVVPLSSNSIVMMVVTQSGKVESKIFNVEEELDISDLLQCVDTMNKILAGHRLSEIEHLVEHDFADKLGNYLVTYEYLVDALIAAVMKFSHDYIYVSGKNNIINQPDFNDINKVRNLINIMENDQFFQYLLEAGTNPSVKIGDENEIIEVDDVSIVTSNYQISETEKGVIAIVGPTRMDYDKVITLLDYVSNRISDLIQGNRGGSNE